MNASETPRTCQVCGSDVDDPNVSSCDVCGADLPRADWPSQGTDTGSATSYPPESAAPADDHPEQDPAMTDQPSSYTAPPPPPPPPAAPHPPAQPAAPVHPSGLPSEYRTWGMLTHLSSFIGAFVGFAFLGPLVMWLVKKDEHPFLDHHGKEALNFNLSLLLYGVIGFVATILTLGIGLVVFLPGLLIGFVIWVVFSIQGAIRANNGEGYRYPLTIRFISD